VLSFSDRLAAAVRRCKTPVLVGLDPRADSLPAPVAPASSSAADVARAYVQFCQGVVDVVAPLVPAVKPQAAFFEALGVPGMAALKQVIDYAAAKDLLVILDGKRNDIDSTALAYAQAYLGPGDSSPWGADALTVSPYLGDDSLTPFETAARERSAGIFVLVKTSNRGGKRFQDLKCEGRPLYLHVAEYVESLAAGTRGECGYGAVGAVVGATYPQQLVELRAAMPSAWLLVPGYGSQGGTAADVAAGFDAQGLGAIVNNSRGLIFAHGRPEFAQFGPSRWQEAVEGATRRMIAELAAGTPAGRLQA
jgi:orotidine-5'-phosphate decarboxylase